MGADEHPAQLLREGLHMGQGALLGDLVGKSLNSHCDTHIDPPATTIFILTIVINAVSSVINA